jgi:plastocyanin
MVRRLVMAGSAATLAVAISIGSAGAAGTVKIKAVNTKFKPAKENVKVGQKVKWTSEEGKHSVTFNDLNFDKVIKKGDSVARTFKVEGDWFYFCRFHSGMEGVITATG